MSPPPGLGGLVFFFVFGPLWKCLIVIVVCTSKCGSDVGRLSNAQKYGIEGGQRQGILATVHKGCYWQG